MPRYTVNVSLTFIGWVDVEADDKLTALEAANQMSARDFDYDPDTGQVDFNITPQIEVSR